MPQSDPRATPPGIDHLQYLLGKPIASGKIRQQPADFFVSEQLGFEPSGKGEHLWINITKELLNTADVVSLIARDLSLQHRDIGTSGLKDRNAVTEQWISIPKGTEPDNRIALIESVFAQHPQLTLNTISVNQGKLKTGTHKNNQFRIVVRELDADQETIEQRIDNIIRNGAPNYFGAQRFGRNGKNLLTARKLFQQSKFRLDRTARSMAISSARSWIFNEVLSQRLAKGMWDQAVVGDALLLDGSNAFFVHDGSDPAVVDRIRDHDLHITGPLWGAGQLSSEGSIAEFEKQVVSEIDCFPEGLVAIGLKQQRRALRVVPKQFAREWVDRTTLKLGFTLPKGAFATAILRELINS